MEGFLTYTLHSGSAIVNISDSISIRERNLTMGKRYKNMQFTEKEPQMINDRIKISNPWWIINKSTITVN